MIQKIGPSDSMGQYEEKYKESIDDNAEFWRKRALEMIHWSKPFTTIHTG